MKHGFPWLMAFMALLILLVSNGLTVTGLSAFDESLLAEFGWSRGALKFRDLITLLLAGVMAPFVGILIDRIGPKVLVISGCLMLALLYVAYANIQSIAHVYLIHVGFAAVLVAAGLNVAVILVSQWFVARRGTAIGIALVGTSLGGVFVPQLVVSLIQAHGWRESFMWLTLIPLAMMVLVALLVRLPRADGPQPLGAGQPVNDTRAGRAVANAALPDIGYRQALRTRTFWALALVAMCTFYSIMAVSANLFLHMRDMQFSLQEAGNALGVMFGLGMVGKFLFGFLADLFRPKAVFLANLAIMAAGALLLATVNPALVWYALVLFGLGWGGLYTMIQLLAVNAFGLSSAGKILGTVTMCDAITAGLGIWFTALLYDRFGSYQIAFGIMCALVLAALAAATLVRNERVHLAAQRAPGSAAAPAAP